MMRAAKLRCASTSRVRSATSEARSCDSSMPAIMGARIFAATTRSEEHTSELQSQSNLVCRLLLEKKNLVVPSHCVQLTHILQAHAVRQRVGHNVPSYL